MEKHLSGAVRAVRLSSRLQLAAFFPPSGRRGGSAPPPALMVDVRVIICRHFPIGRGRIVQVVAKDMDILLRRQQARKLRLPECVELALAEDVIPLVEHPFDRGAVVAAREKICEYVAGACADPRLAEGGAQVLVLLDTFACPVFLRPPHGKPMMTISTGPSKHAAAADDDDQPMKKEFGIAAAVPSEKARSIGVIGDGRPKKVDERIQGEVEVEERWKGLAPWQKLQNPIF